MIFSRRIYFIILAHILSILATSGTGLWMIVTHTGYIIGGILIVCALFQIAGLTRQLNNFNQKIKLFFDAVQDKDNMLYFPEQNVSKEQQQLNRALNRINDLLAQTKTENHTQEHFYRSLLEAVPSGILAWNRSGKVIIANSAAFSLLGCRQIANRSQLNQLLENKKNLSLSESRMRLQDETLTLLSIKDIGDELSDKESESWNKLTHVLTHEIMNTIAPVISLSQTLMAYPGLHEKAARGLSIIRAQSERLMEFTESFRHLSYLPHPEKKRFSLSGLLHNLEELLQSDFTARGIRLSLQCPSGSIEIEADENQLSQVLLNLLKNSKQALEGQTGGSISVCVHKTDRLLIEITDSGPGIPANLQEKIFIPFFTTKPEGTGIGLSLCRQVIRRHEGHLFIRESRPGQTVFCIDLPA